MADSTFTPQDLGADLGKALGGVSKALGPLGKVAGPIANAFIPSKASPQSAPVATQSSSSSNVGLSSPNASQSSNSSDLPSFSPQKSSSTPNPVVQNYLNDSTIDMGKRQGVMNALKAGQDPNQLAGLISQKYGTKYASSDTSGNTPTSTPGDSSSPSPSSPKQGAGAAAGRPWEDLPSPGQYTQKDFDSSPVGQFVQKEAPQLDQATKDEVSINPLDRAGKVLGQVVGGAGNVAGGILNMAGNEISQVPNVVKAVGDLATGNVSPTDTAAGQKMVEQSQQGIKGLNQSIEGAGQTLTAPLAASPVLSKAASLPFEAAHDAIGGILQKSAGIDPNTESGQNITRSILNALTMTAMGPKNITEGITGVLDKGVAAGEAVKNIPGALDESVKNGIKEDWQRPTTKTGFKKAASIYENAAAQGHDISETLINNKVDLSQNIEDGKYATKETASQMRQDAAKMSNDILRPSLEKADMTLEKTPVEDVIQSAAEKITKDKGITVEDKGNLIKQLDATKAALKTKFPDGMSLTDLQDEKITRDLNAKYSPVGDIATNRAATLNKAVADSTRGLIEKNAPSDIPVKEFNKELSKQYQAANYLEALDGKKVVQSTMSKLGKGVVKAGITTAGAALGGIGGFAGSLYLGKLVNLLDNVPNPLKAGFLKNLEVSNPAAFQQVQSYLAK